MHSNFVHRGGWWVVAQNALTLVVLFLGPLTRGAWRSWSSIVAGTILLVLGAVFGISGVRDLGRMLTPYPKPRDQGTLVQHGIYSLVRHPLYSSLIFLSFGWALFWGSWLTHVAALALTVVLHRKAMLEERWLCEKYPDYAHYARRVRRFVPWII